MSKLKQTKCSGLAIVAGCILLSAGAALAEGLPKNLPRQTLATALEVFARETGVQVLYSPDVAVGLMSKGASAGQSTQDTLRDLLRDTGLTFEFVNERTVTIRPAKATLRNTSGGALPQLAGAAPNRLARVDAAAQENKATQQEGTAAGDTGSSDAGIPEVLVRGSKVLNMDIRRTRDAPQPYVIIDRSVIERSGAASIGDLLKQRLPMNTAVAQANQSAGNITGNSSSINLRGMGVQQTLLLIDGRRIAEMSIGNFVSQASLNGIPLSAIDRIEVLPATAGGIYGGSATGGVVNVILRRDYAGMETMLTYENTLQANVPKRQIDISSGFTLEGGRTSVLLAGSYSSAGQLLVNERDFGERGRARILRNNPGFYLDATTPPMGATTNIRSATGVNLTLDNGTALNSPYTHVPAGYLGRAASDGGMGFVPNAGRYNFELAPTASFFDDSADRGMLNGPTVKSLMTTLRREFAPGVDAFLEASVSENEGRISTNLTSTRYTLPADAPTNPFQQAINVAVPIAAADGQFLSTQAEVRVAGGAVFRLPASWTLGLDYSWHRGRMNYSETLRFYPAAATAVTSGTLDVLRDLSRYPLDFTPYSDAGKPSLDAPAALQPWALSTNRNATLRVGGPLRLGLRKDPVLSAMVERRDMDMNRTREDSRTFALSFYYPARAQSVDSAYLELQLPVVAADDSIPWVHELKFQLAGRHDVYTTSTTGGNVSVALGAPAPADTFAENEVSSTDPTLAVTYKPSPDVALRASWGTGFLPPPTNGLVTSFGGSATIVDPRRGNSTYTVTGTSFGGNPDLRPEITESWSAGLILTPRFAPGLRLSLDYTAIDKKDGISASLSGQFVVDNESLLPERLVRGPRLGTDPAGWAGPVTSMDLRRANLSQLSIEAYDLQLDQRLDFGSRGSLDLFALATWTTHYTTRVTSAAPEVELAGITRSNPLRLKGNAGATWTHGNLTLNWTAYYYHSYLVANPASAASVVTFLNQGGRTVSADLFHDLYAKVGLARLFGGGSTFLPSSTELTVGVRNVFNTRPAFDASAFPYYNQWADPRMATYYISLKAGF